MSDVCKRFVHADQRCHQRAARQRLQGCHRHRYSTFSNLFALPARSNPKSTQVTSSSLVLSVSYHSSVRLQPVSVKQVYAPRHTANATHKRLPAYCISAAITGGGGGHEPGQSGYVGEGMLAAAVSGHLFASPSAKSVLAAIRAVAGKAGCLLIVTNYTGKHSYACFSVVALCCTYAGQHSSFRHVS